MYREFTRAVAVSRPWYTDGRRPSLCCQHLLSDIWLVTHVCRTLFWVSEHGSTGQHLTIVCIFVNQRSGVVYNLGRVCLFVCRLSVRR